MKPPKTQPTNQPKSTTKTPDQSSDRLQQFLKKLNTIEQQALKDKDFRFAFKLLELQAKCLLHLEHSKQFELQRRADAEPVQIEIIPPEPSAFLTADDQGR